MSICMNCDNLDCGSNGLECIVVGATYSAFKDKCRYFDNGACELDNIECSSSVMEQCLYRLKRV